MVKQKLKTICHVLDNEQMSWTAMQFPFLKRAWRGQVWQAIGESLCVWVDYSFGYIPIYYIHYILYIFYIFYTLYLYINYILVLCPFYICVFCSCLSLYWENTAWYVQITHWAMQQCQKCMRVYTMIKYFCHHIYIHI